MIYNRSWPLRLTENLAFFMITNDVTITSKNWVSAKQTLTLIKSNLECLHMSLMIFCLIAFPVKNGINRYFFHLCHKTWALGFKALWPTLLINPESFWVEKELPLSSSVLLETSLLYLAALVSK